MDFVVPADHKVRLKESKKRQILSPSGELKMHSGIAGDGVPITVGTVSKGLEHFEIGVWVMNV